MNKFEHFIKQEKIYSDTFLKNSQILDCRFSEYEYRMLKSIWLNQDLINNIYNIADDILKKDKLNKELRFLIVGDLFFSIFSNTLSDPCELIYKVSRNDYIQRIRLRAAINIVFGCDYYKYINIHQTLLIGLRLNKIAEKVIVRIKNNNDWVTMIYYIIKVNVEFPVKEWLIGFSNKPFIIVSIHNIKYSVGSFRNIWKIKRKKREMEEIDICYNSIVKANQIELTLSTNLYELNEIHILKEKKRILDEVRCLNFEEYLSEFRKVLKDSNQSSNYNVDREFVENYNKLTKYFQKIISMEVLNMKIFNRAVYLPCFMDNRGRQYYGTIISPTFYVLFRYLYEFRLKKIFLELENSKFYKKIMIYKYLVVDFSLNDKKSYILIVLFMEVDKFFIDKNKNYMIKTEKIIQSGIDNYKINNINLNFNDILYIEKIYFSLRELINNNIIDNNMIIFKDATASGLQNLGILLGYKEEKLKYLNINNDDSLCDTYGYLMEKFLKDETKIFWKREYWKNTIMTIPYNSVWFSCFEKFIDKIKKDGIEYNKMSMEDKERIKKMHKNFYVDIKDKIKDEFYNNDNNSLLKFKYNEWRKIDVKEYKINYKKARDKYTNTLYMLIDDEKATKRALEANNMHYLDALLVKELLKKFEILSIHDDFGVRLCELHLLIDEINLYYSTKIGKETYSIHVII